MSCKTDIGFLLNPTVQTLPSLASCRSPDRMDYGIKVAVSPSSPSSMSLFRSLSPVTSNPEATTPAFEYRRRFVAPYMAPLEKRRSNLRCYGSSRTQLPKMSMAELCSDCSSSLSSYSSDDERSETSSVLSMESKTHVRKTQSPPCQVEGCKNLAVSRGCCVRHGGGSKCTAPGCTKRAKLYQRCFQHGGFKMCTEPGCTKKAKRYGHCWSHGGGHICEVPECTKVSTQGGFCWAHGGGNRCKHEGCNRRSYLKYDYYCQRHAAPVKVDASA
ncbi:hypothetical protein BBJ28_00023209 [Nothophytophthora sp. Chile5]|nr:hypothetical protein BBJ28_00023209 [Nothophytophthora sp. Chile5]